jgi:hypothetical protein
MDTENILSIAASLDEELLSTRPRTGAHDLVKQRNMTTVWQTDKIVHTTWWSNASEHTT